MTMRTVEIVGGGLAGLALGLGLRRAGVPVVLHEAGGYPRHRVCGEFMTGLSAETQARLGLDAVLADALEHREAAWFHGGRLMCHQTLDTPAIALSRHVLDRRLVDALTAAGGEVRTGSRLPVEAASEGRVFASGRRPESGSPWIGLKLHVRGLVLDRPLEMHLGGGGYVGLCAIEGGRVNVAGLFRRRPGLSGERERMLFHYLRAGGLGDLAGRLEAADPDPESACAVAGLNYGRARRRADDGRLSVGDADGLIPPFTGHGMALALTSAEVALDPLIDWAAGRGDWASALARGRAEARARFGLRRRAARWLHPALTHSVGQRTLGWLGRAGLLPMGALYRLTH
ncbi:MAG: FAD-dependent monooxygenase [Verrucomicrobiota bacterium]